MAKTKQDYYSDGALDATRQTLIGLPFDRAATSWQARAYFQGFDDQRLKQQGSEAVADFQRNGDPAVGIPPAQDEGIGAVRFNTDGSVSETVDNGDGTAGTLTRGCPPPRTPVIHVPCAPGGVPIPAPAIHRDETPMEVLPVASAHALGAHITALRTMARQDATANPRRAARLTAKADALLAGWRVKLERTRHAHA